MRAHGDAALQRELLYAAEGGDCQAAGRRGYHGRRAGFAVRVRAWRANSRSSACSRHAWYGGWQHVDEEVVPAPSGGGDVCALLGIVINGQAWVVPPAYGRILV